MDAVRLIKLVRSHLDASGHPFALAGAFALNALGLGRETHDLDLIKAGLLEDWNALQRGR